MFGRSRPFAGGLMASVAALAIGSGFFMVDSTARSMADPSAQTVNRALKGDRLPFWPASLSHVENQPVEWREPRVFGSGSEIAGRLRSRCELHRQFRAGPHCRPLRLLERWRVIFSENRHPLFGITLWAPDIHNKSR